MTVFRDIDAALDGRLNDMPGSPPVVWENQIYEPAMGTLYLKPNVLPAETIQASMGDSGQDMTSGVYQISIFAKVGTGKKTSTDVADMIGDQFKRGTILTYNGRGVRISSVSRKAGSKTGDGWYLVPVEIVYISYTESRV